MPARKLLITGPPGSGKTTRLLEWYRALVRAGVRSDQILVLVTHTPAARAFQEALGLEATGPVQAMSYLDWAGRELRLHWETVESWLPPPAGGSRAAEPLFLHLAEAQYLMQHLLAERRPEGPLMGVRATTPRLAILCTGHLLTVAAATGVPAAEIGARLAAAAGGDPDGLYAHLDAVLRAYRDICLDGRVLDYGLTLELYGRLWQDPAYRRHLRDRIRHLIADDLDESVPAMQDFIRDLLPDLESAVLALCPDGGHAAFRGADAARAYATFRPLCAEERLGPSRTAHPAAVALGEALAARLRGEDRPLPVPGPEAGFHLSRSDHPLRTGALEAVARTVAGWVARGVPPGEIAVIAPAVDPVLIAHLTGRLAPLGARVADLTRSRRLLDDPCARALLALIALAHPEWHLELPAGTLAVGLGLLLQVDPVRAGLLGRALARAGDLIALEDAHLRQRLGSAAAARYDALREWVLRHRGAGLPIDQFCAQAAARLLLPLAGDRDRWAPCRQVVAAAHRFRRVWERVRPLQAEPAGRHFFRMLLGGALAAEPPEPPGADPRAVLVATPYAFLTARRSVRFQVWADLCSGAWLRTDVKELVNPHVLSRRRPGERWTAADDLRARRENAARTVQALLCRCREGLVLVGSELSGWGLEEEGGLAPFLPALPEGVGAGG